MKDGLFKGELYNQLPHDKMRLDGHYTVLFTVPNYDIYLYKHADYYNLVSYEPLEFNGFLTLNEAEKKYLISCCKSTFDRKSVCWEENKHATYSRCHTNWPYDLFGIPSYMQPFLT